MIICISNQISGKYLCAGSHLSGQVGRILAVDRADRLALSHLEELREDCGDGQDDDNDDGYHYNYHNHYSPSYCDDNES